MSIDIIATSSYTPRNILTNTDLSQMVETTDEWILKRTGIKERAICDPSETTLNMALNAITAIKDFEFDALIVATFSAEDRMPNLASKILNKLKLNHIPGFDINVACSGFIYALSIAKTLIDSGKYQRIMVVGVDKNSKHVDWTDRNTCCLFGDGAGAIIIGKSTKKKFFDFTLGCDTEFADDLKTTKNAMGDEFLEMNGKQVFKLAVTYGERMVKAAIEQLNGELPDYLIFHQANKRIIDGIIKEYGIPSSRVSYALENQGNTSAASIPLALDQAIKNNDIKSGDHILMIAFGAGFSWGSVLIEY